MKKNIELLRQYRTHVYLISCGTVLSVLLHHDIEPDLQVNLESELAAFEVLYKMSENKNLSYIPIAASIQSLPSLIKDFGTAFIYLKREATCNLVFDSNHYFLGTHPSCANAAASIILQAGFKHIGLIALDFGFYTLAHHHAPSSVYYQAQAESVIQKTIAQTSEQLFKIPACDGNEIWTK